MEELPPVMAFAELAVVLGVSKTRVTALMARPDFPAPIAVLTVGRIWATSDVAAYCERHGRQMLPL